MMNENATNKKMKLGLRIVLGIAIVLVVLFVVGSVVIGKMVRDGIFYQNKNNDTKGNSWKQMEIWGYDTEKVLSVYDTKDFTVEAMDGVVVPATCFYAKEDQQKYVVIAHGAGGDRMSVLPVAEVFLKNGYHVIAYDQRGSGDSSSDIVSFGIWEKRDMQRLVDYARQECNAKEVIVCGQSMGGMTTALYAATEHAYENVDAVILDSPVPSMEEMLFNMFTEDGTDAMVAEYILQCGKWYCQLANDFHFEEGNTKELMRNNHCKTLVIASIQDEICLLPDVEVLFEKIASEDKKLVKFDSKHIEGCIDNPERYEACIMEFLQK